jgi:predicted PurR-regulated permease PerM
VKAVYFGFQTILLLFQFFVLIAVIALYFKIYMKFRRLRSDKQKYQNINENLLPASNDEEQNQDNEQQNEQIAKLQMLVLHLVDNYKDFYMAFHTFFIVFIVLLVTRMYFYIIVKFEVNHDDLCSC